jgi:plasmid stabilization system protein ParE
LASLRFTPEALDDLQRLAAFLVESDPAASAQTIPMILDGLRVLATHPLIGRPIDVKRRELLIFRGRTGYLAQYTLRFAQDEVIVLAVRHQRKVDEI